MDKTGSTSQLAPKTAHREFFQWAVKWFYANVPENTSTKPDIPSIICLLQAAGFKLREFEKQDQLISIEEPVKNENIRITMECGTSKMVAILEMDEIKCMCPNTNEAKDGSFWSISGTGPVGSMDNLNKVEETGSNLLPEMSKDVTSVVRDVVYRLFKLINNKGDINQNTDSNMNLPALAENNTPKKSTEIKEGLVRSYTDINDQNYKPRTVTKIISTLMNSRYSSTKSVKDSVASDTHNEKPKLNRQGTYQVNDDNESMDEPRPSPPKVASSPVLHQLCTSLGQISLQSDEEILGLADYVVKAHQILDKAVNFIMKKIPLNSSHSSIQEDGNFIKPTAPPLMSSSFCVSGSPRSNGGGATGAVNGGFTMNRSVSSASASVSSRAGSTSSVPTRPPSGIGNRAVSASTKVMPTVRRTSSSSVVTTNLPIMRDRSSSFTATQRPPVVTPKSVVGTASARRRTTTGITTSAQRTPVASKLPAGRVKSSMSNSLTVERAVLTAKRRISPDAKGQIISSPAVQQRSANVSLLKAPSSTSRLSGVGTAANHTSKFGFSTAKK